MRVRRSTAVATVSAAALVVVVPVRIGRDECVSTAGGLAGAHANCPTASDHPAARRTSGGDPFRREPMIRHAAP